MVHVKVGKEQRIGISKEPRLTFLRLAPGSGHENGRVERFRHPLGRTMPEVDEVDGIPDKERR